MEKHLARHLEKHNLHITEWKLLGLMSTQKDLQPAQIAKLLGVKRPFVTVLLQKMVDKNLLERNANEKDRRYHQVVITAFGKETIQTVEKEIKGLLKKLTSGLNFVELIAYGNVLKTIIKNGEAMDTNLLDS
jgi:DNA-binding MarR family transcriptional regulator